jgi:hypothetical protein
MICKGVRARDMPCRENNILLFYYMTLEREQLRGLKRKGAADKEGCVRFATKKKGVDISVVPCWLKG